MKKFIIKSVFVFLLMNLGLTIQMTVVNAQIIKTPLEKIKEIGKETGLPSYVETGVHPDAPPDYLQPGVAAATSPVLFAIDLFRYVISGIALIVVITAAVKLISTSTEEEAGKAKNALLIGIIGLIVIQLADVAVTKMFFGDQGEAFEDIATAELYAEQAVSQIRGIIGFVEAFLGAIAVLVIIIRGFAVLTSAGDEEAITKAKTHILYAIAGLAVVGLSELIVRGFVFPDAGEALPKVEVGKQIIISITNYLSGFIAIFSFAALFYSGYQYVTSGGEEDTKEKVKRTMVGAAIALILALGAFAAVNTFVKFETPIIEEEATPQPEIV